MTDQSLRDVRWFADSNGIVLTDRDPTGQSGEPLSRATKIAGVVSVVVGLVMVGLAVWIFLGHDVTVVRRGRERELSPWLALFFAAILLLAPWAFARNERTGGVTNRRMTLTEKRFVTVIGASTYRIPWEDIQSVRPHGHDEFIQLALAKSAHSYAVLGKKHAETSANLVVPGGRAAREVAVINHLRTTASARANIASHQTADWANTAG